MGKKGLSGLKHILKHMNNPTDLQLAYMEVLTTWKHPHSPVGLTAVQLAAYCFPSNEIRGETVHH